MSTAHRAKIKHKARETKKKRKKEAKKNPHLKKKKKKDPGIPNSFPFKEQILAEVAETRRLALEEKRRKEARVDIEGNGHILEIQKEPVAVQARPSKMDVDDDAPILIDTSIPTTAAALDAANVILYLLDARDPWSFRSIYVEEATTKPILFVLTKTDLAPRESVNDWIIQLRKRRPTFIFRATPSLCFKNTPQSGSNTKSQSEDAGCIGREAILEALHTIAQSQKEADLSVAVIGVTNVGKSAFINSLLGTSTLAVYNPLGPKATAAPSTTPYPQSVSLQHKKRQFTFIDTPGLTFIPPPSATSTPEETEERIARDVLLRNRGNISKIKDPLPLALYILSRASMEDLILLYNLPAVTIGDFDAFLAGLARKEGALQKRGAIVDFTGAARALVRDWKTGRLAFYTFSSPQQLADDPKTSSPPSTPDLSSVYTKWDEKYLARLSWRKDLRKEANISLVRLKDDELDRRKVDLEAVLLPSDDEMDSQDGGSPEEDEDDSEEDGEEESEDEEGFSQEDENDSEGGEEVDAMGASDEEEEGSDEESEPILSGKQKRAAQKATKLETSKQTLKAQKSKKAVSFVPYTKAGAKVKPQPKPASTAQPKPSAALPREKKKTASSHVPTSTRVANVASKASKAAEAAGDDAYDFSKYF